MTAPRPKGQGFHAKGIGKCQTENVLDPIVCRVNIHASNVVCCWMQRNTTRTARVGTDAVVVVRHASENGV